MDTDRNEPADLVPPEVPNLEEAIQPSPARDLEDEFPVVGVGASAGGLEALEQFFTAMPADSGMAFIVVQHLSPDFKSLMDELLSRRTAMPVNRVEDGMPIRPNAVYLIPPRKDMKILGRRLHLMDKDPNKSPSLPIDTFFRSLAQDCGEQAVAIVLSGTGSDGSRGVRSIHDAGGLVLAQDERSAKFDGMPRSAADAGVVDFILSPQEMPAVLLRHASQPKLSAALAASDGPGDRTALTVIFRLLREGYGIDFSHYKPTTVVRRIRRRLQMHQLYDVEDYVERLKSDAEELDRLYHDLLIGVTRFFRDAEAFEWIEREGLPGLLANLSAEDELRVWVAGCATGEEAYTFAILIHEACERLQRPIKARVFATDVHRTSLEHASAGLYTETSVAGVSPERLARFFARKGNQYQVSTDLRKLVVFAPHDVVRDAPFTKLDLVSCRNLLIYLEPAAQRRTIALFHFGLKTGGVLLLGPSETPAELQPEFETLEPHWRIYRKRRNLKLPPDIRLPLPATTTKLHSASAPAGAAEPSIMRAYDALLDHFIPPSILLNDQRKVVHTFAGAGKYLAYPNGRTSGEILDLVGPELKMCLAAGLQQAARDRTPVVYGGVRAGTTDGEEKLRVTIRPIALRDGDSGYFQVILEPPASAPAMEEATTRDAGDASLERLSSLEEELQTTRENLQTSIQDLETSNEELQAANEELVAANEELQSTNEELHSVNEELYTVNAEHQRKIGELTQLTNDMDNLLRGTDVGTIFLDADLQIRDFTPQVTKAFQLLPQDVGRRINNFNHSIRHKGLVADIEEVIRTDTRVEREVFDGQGRAYLLRILPYRTKVKVEGAVLTLIDVTTLRKAKADRRRMSKVFMDGTDPIIIEDLSGRVLDLNLEAEQVYGWPRGDLIGRHISELIPPEHRAAEEALRERCRRGERVHNAESSRQARDGSKHAVMLTFSLLTGEDREPDSIATIAKDISERKQAEHEARTAVMRRDQFLAMLSHELRNPLAAVLTASQVMARSGDDLRSIHQARDIIERQAKHAARLLDDLLDVGRMTQGKIALQKSQVDLTRLLQDALVATRTFIESRRHRVHVETPPRPLFVHGDPARMLQIMENLLTNATKYTPPGGEIGIHLRRDGDSAVLEVADTGVGIPNEHLDSIFNLFTQLDSSLDRSERGLGVGLSMVKMLAEMHEGQVCATSDGPGRGSRFTVRLPVIDAKEAPATERVDGDGSPPVAVLLVEDIADSRNVMRRLLSLDGHEVRVAADGHEGLASLISQPPDVALIDVGLPGIDGYEIARIARKNPALERVRLVALTGYGRPEDREAVLAAGFDEHLVKPVHPQELMRILKPRMLDGSALEKS